MIYLDSGLTIGLLGCKGFAKIAKLSDAILIPCIIVLALILGSLAEKGLRRSLLISDGNPAIFFESPVCIVLINLCFFGILSPIFMAKLESKMQKSQTDEENITN
ncbi:MAG: hypothetical protein IIX56_00020 [Treponema sp.]|nr:hypothetical protein [Treponema sp.]MBR0545141.1 hypothetical protein [Treponema sp.]